MSLKKEKTFKERVCLRCDEKGCFRYLCNKCITTNNRQACGLMHPGDDTWHANKTRGKS